MCRTTTKYWVRREDVFRLQVAIVRHLPVLVYEEHAGKMQDDVPVCAVKGSTDNDGPAYAVKGSTVDDGPVCAVKGSADGLAGEPACNQAGYPAPAKARRPSLSFPQRSSTPHQQQQQSQKGKEQAKAEARLPSAPITSVYFDSTSLAVYHQRLFREDGASLVRVRWYGPPTASLWPEHVLSAFHSESHNIDPSTNCPLASSKFSDPPPQQKESLQQLQQLQTPVHPKLFLERKRHRDAWTGELSLKVIT
eukprot:356868-Chlamydomonas_euryale.AAC.14